jgi:hypothetical protein
MEGKPTQWMRGGRNTIESERRWSGHLHGRRVTVASFVVVYWGGDGRVGRSGCESNHFCSYIRVVGECARDRTHELGLSRLTV